MLPQSYAISSSRRLDNYVRILEEAIINLSQRTDPIKTLARVLTNALALSGLEVGALLVVSDERKHMNVIVRRDIADEIVQQLTEGELSKILLSGQQIWLEPQPFQLEANQALLGRHRLRCLYGLPLQFDRNVLGAIVVGTRREVTEPLYQRLQQHLPMLARLVTLFLENMRLRTAKTLEPPPPAPAAPNDADRNATIMMDAMPKLPEDLEELLAAVMSAEEEVARQNEDLDMLNTLSHEVGSSLNNLEEVLQKAVHLTKHALKAKASWCYLLEDDTLVMRGQTGLSASYVAGMRNLTAGSGTEGMAIRRNEPILRDSVLFHSGKARDLVRQEGLLTVAAIPLCDQDKNLGALAVGWTQARESWSMRDRRMLGAISRQIIWAVANSQMFARIKKEAMTWENSYLALQQANTMLNKRAEALENELENLRQAEQQIWTALAASQEARRAVQQANDGEEDALAKTLRRILAAMGVEDE